LKKIPCILILIILICTSISTHGTFINDKIDKPGYISVNIDPNNISPWIGYTLFSPMGSKNSYLLDIDKEIVHIWNTDYFPGVSAYLLGNGNLLRTTKLINPYFQGASMGGSGGGIQEINPDGNVVWDFEYSNYQHLAHHDIEILPNGNILMIAWEMKSRSEAIYAGRNPNQLGQELWSEHIIELEPTGYNSGRIVWQWHVWDHLIQDYDPSKENYGNVSEHPELIDINFMADSSPDWLHINAIDYNNNYNQIMLSVNYFSEI
jgi:hypothetical protein